MISFFIYSLYFFNDFVVERHLKFADHLPRAKAPIELASADTNLRTLRGLQAAWP